MNESVIYLTLLIFLIFTNVDLDKERKNELGWVPSLQFEEGLVKTISWYLANEKWMKNITSGDYQKYYQQQYN